jgi:solute:Na+ symporter, SSS family
MGLLDLGILVTYCVGVVAFGSGFVRRSRTPEGFTRAGGALPSWAVGLSLFGTYLSSNTFLGNPGKAYAANWNSFVFSLSIPLAAWIAVKYFVPFYRASGEISAYTHLEKRFGRWARIYAMVCYLLTQLARIGSILLGVALVLGPLTGTSPRSLILATGAMVTVYTLLGGIEAVIWTDVVQSVILVGGALLSAGLLLVRMPEGPAQLFTIASAHGKFDLGSMELDFTSSTIWVVLLYGFCINLNNFGIDQSYVQRYHAAKTTEEAGRSVWMAAWLYLPISLLFFFIGSGLFAYYQARPEPELRALLESSGGGAAAIGDRVFPYFIAHDLPTGISGLVVAALLAAAMSSIDTSLNSSATVVLSDLYRSYVNQDPSDAESMRVLYLGTLAVGALGTAAAVAMIGVSSLLDAWWTLSGLFASGMLGLFLLGIISRRPDRGAAIAAVGLGVAIIFWMTFSPGLPPGSLLRSPFHTNMTIVVGTLTILLTGMVVSRLRSPSKL